MTYVFRRSTTLWGTVKGVTALRGGNFVVAVVVTGGVTAFSQNPDFVAVEVVVVAKS